VATAVATRPPAAKGVVLPANVRSVPREEVEQRELRRVRMTRRRVQHSAGDGRSARPIVADDPTFGEIGTSGLRQYGGFVLEEWLPKLRGRYGAWAYRELLDNSPIVGGIMFAARQLARQVTFRVEDDIEMSGLPCGFIESCMHDMKHTWDDFISEGLSHAGYGWALHEEIFKRRDGERPVDRTDFLPWQEEALGVSDTTEPSPWEPPKSQYKDGLVGWRELPIRAQETLMRWHFRGYSELKGMEQIDWHGGKHDIPIAKSILFRTETTRKNPEGRSLLRNAWTSYFALNNIQSIEAIGIERDLAGLPMLIPPDGVDLSQPAFAHLLTVAEDLVQGVRRDEDEGIVLPQHGWEFSLVHTGGSRQIDTDAVIRRYEQRMTVVLLADWLITGQDAMGSYAMVDVKTDMFGLALDAILGQMCEVLNRYAIPRLLALNGMKPAKRPRILCSSVGRVDLRTLGEFLTNLSLAGAPIPWTEPLMQHLWHGANLPQPDFTPSAQIAPAQPSPTAHDSQWRPSWGSENAPAPEAPKQREHVAKAEQHTGAMIALYPHPEIAARLAQTGGEDPDHLHVTLAYLGDAGLVKEPERLRQVLAGWAASTRPLEGLLQGAGMFETTQDGSCVYASPDLPELAHARQRLVDALHHSGYDMPTEHGFVPHITLNYGSSRLPRFPKIPLTFDTVSLVLAGQRQDFPLASEARKAEREPRAGEGTLVNLAPMLTHRQGLLSTMLEREIEGALRDLGVQTGTAYASIAEKSMTPRQIERLVGRVMSQTRLGEWLRNRLQPVLRNHAGRVAEDTARTIGSQVGQEGRRFDEAAHRRRPPTGGSSPRPGSTCATATSSRRSATASATRSSKARRTARTR
jgi:2'-5' RNA ligase